MRLHARSADAEKHGIGQTLFQGSNEVAGQEIPGRLPCHHGNPNGATHISE
jgi:hypothetical protein